jgi:hypothetical protein
LINPKDLPSRDRNSSTDSYSQRMIQQKMIREWFLSPLKFFKEIEQEQRKYPDNYIYHLTKSHPTVECYVKKECDKILRSKKPSTPNSVLPSGNTSGQLCHVTEEVFEDVVTNDNLSVTAEPLGNDTNEEDLLFFARISKHYLRLVTNSVQRERVF